MKKLTTIALLTLGGLTLAAQTVTPTPVAYTADDLFLGFRASGGTGATLDYLVDIGQASTFRDASSAFTVSGLGDISADLSHIFGAAWSTRSDLFWSISGTPGASAVGADTAKLMYATQEEVPQGTQSNPWKGNSGSGQGNTVTLMTSLAFQYVALLSGSANLSTSNSLVGIVQNTSDANSYATYMPGGSNAGTGTVFKYFQGTIEGSFVHGTAGSTLDLYRIPVGYNVPGTLKGTFTINDSAQLTYTPTPTPEPTTYSLLVLGSALLFAGKRRRAAVAQ